jgi:hypothetical protein
MKLEDSLREVLAQKELVIEKFYATFLAEHPEARVYFERLDMTKQSLMLSAALIVSEAHSREDFPRRSALPARSRISASRGGRPERNVPDLSRLPYRDDPFLSRRLERRVDQSLARSLGQGHQYHVRRLRRRFPILIASTVVATFENLWLQIGRQGSPTLTSVGLIGTLLSSM